MKDNRRYKYRAYIVGDAIYKKRKSMLKTQEEFAEIIGIDPKQLGELERGNAFPNFITAIRLREKLDISIDELIDEIIENFPDK